MRARIITALALAPVAVLLTLWSPAWLFAIAALGIMLAALAEWNRLRPDTAAIGVAAVLIILAVLLFRSPQKLPMVCLAGALFWVYQAFELTVKKADSAPRAGDSLVRAGFIFLFAWAALVWVRVEQGALMTIAMLLVVWSADIFAYFTGRRFGRRKLAPSISPGKTVEGLAGGLVGAGLVALAVVLLAPQLSAANTLIWLLAALIAALFSVVGDLYESRLKRRAGAKDSGSLLPGHGGILDRIDGLLAAAPVFATIWWLSE